VLRYPEVEIIEESRALVSEIFSANGGNQTIGRGFRGLLNDAGFADVKALDPYESHGTAEVVAERAEHFANLWSNPPFYDRVIELGLATSEYLVEFASAWGRGEGEPIPSLPRHRAKKSIESLTNALKPKSMSGEKKHVQLHARDGQDYRQW